MIKQIGLPLLRRPIVLITGMITDRIGLHSVLLSLQSVKMLLVIFRNILIIGSSHVGLFINKIKEISIGFQISANERS